MTVLAASAACSAGTTTSSTTDAGIPSTSRPRVPFDPTTTTTLDSGSERDLPVFIFLFTHTEDPFNHQLSEERYTRLIPVVDRIASENPDSHLAWTIMFQGSDARTVAERNATTGVLDLLQAADQSGLVEFGYHAQHDPTYVNRPQRGFTADATWEELVTGLDEWVSCRKNLLYGGCEEDAAGGVVAIESLIGDVQVASGLLVWDYFETGAGVHAMRRWNPERILGFGFPDHGPIISSGLWRGPVPELLEILSPEWDTSPSVVWMDDIIRISGGNAPETTTGINTLEGRREAERKLEGLSRDRIQLFNSGIASKYHYTVAGTSPTIYGYSDPQEPELPPGLIHTRADIDAFYQTTEQALRYLAAEFVPNNPGSRFIDSAWLIDHIAPAGYFSVSGDQVDRIAEWVVANWAGAPPAFVYDGLEYFSLRDALVLLSMVRSEAGAGALTLFPAYGPFDDAGDRGSTEIPVVTLDAIATSISADVTAAAFSEWEATPSNLLPSAYDGGAISPAQVLYALAALHLAGDGGAVPGSITVPATRGFPVTLDLLHDIGCPRCFGTAWSLKPARIRLDN